MVMTGGWFVVLLPSHSNLSDLATSLRYLDPKTNPYFGADAWRTRKTDLWKTNGQKQ